MVLDRADVVGSADASPAERAMTDDLWPIY